MTKTLPQKEYVSNGGYYALRTTTLSSSIDDLTSDINQAYEKMLNDPKISKCIYLLKIRVLGNGLDILPCYSESHVDYDNAAAIANFCNIVIRELEIPLRKTLEQLLDGLVYGHKIAEVTWRDIEKEDRKYFIPSIIKVKKNGTVNFIVDNYYNILGFNHSTEGFYKNQTAVIEKEENSDEYKVKVSGKEYPFIQKDKFIYFTFKPKDDDPRGQSILRSAYNAWYCKQQIHPEYMRYLMMCAIPLIVGTTPEEDEDTVSTNILKDSDGNILYNDDGTTQTMSDVEALMQALTSARNATAIAVRGGTKVQEIGAGAANGGGAPFYSAFEFYNTEIEESILLQTLGTSQAVYQPKASAQIHMSTLDEFVFNIKQQLVDIISEGLFKKAILYNFGENYLKYMPVVSLGDTERRDFAKDATAVAALDKVGYLTDDQKIRLDVQLGLPPRQSSKSDTNLTLTEALKINKDALEQESVNYDIEVKKQDLNLKKIKQLVELRNMITEHVITKDGFGNEKVVSLPANLENITVKSIDDTINTLLNDFKMNYNTNKSNNLIDLNLLKTFPKQVEPIDVGENKFPSKTNTVSFSHRLRTLLSRASVDF